jgi:hypothetical protein
MKIKINENILKIDIPGLLRDLLIEKFSSIKNKENPTKIEIKFLAYHTLAYFQYLNTLSTNEAIRLFKDYILTDGKENKIKINGIEIPLYFDDLLNDVTKYLMNYKNIVNTISKDGYVRYFSKKYDINTSDIPIYKIIKNLLNIDIYVLAVLRGHLTILYKEIFPFLLEKAQVTESKE